MVFNNNAASTKVIKSRIYEVRGHRIMIDNDLAELYGVETKKLKRIVRMNKEHFPDDFMFDLTKEEYEFLRCNFFTLKINNQNCLREMAKAIIIEHRSLYRPEGAKPLTTLGNAHCSHITSALALKGQKHNHSLSNNSFLNI